MTDSEQEFDLALFQRAQAGDPAAQQHLLFEFFGPLQRRIAAQIDPQLATTFSADDLIQDTFVEIVRSLDSCRAESRGELIAWVTSIADNRVRTARRYVGRAKRGGGHKRVGVQADRSSLMNILDMLNEDETTPSARAAGHEAEKAIRIGVATLPPDQREAIERRFLDGASLGDVAEQMQKSPAAIRGLIHRGKIALREAMGRSSRWFFKE